MIRLVTSVNTQSYSNIIDDTPYAVHCIPVTYSIAGSLYFLLSLTCECLYFLERTVRTDLTLMVQILEKGAVQYLNTGRTVQVKGTASAKALW